MTVDPTKDVALRADCDRLVIDAKKHLGGLDIIISNAVRFPTEHAVTDAKLSGLDEGGRFWRS